MWQVRRRVVVGVGGIGCTTVSVNSGTMQLLVGYMGRRGTPRLVDGIRLVHVPLQLKRSTFATNVVSTRGRGGLVQLVGTCGRLVGVCSMISCHTYTASTVHSTQGNGTVIQRVTGGANVHMSVVSKRRRTRVMCSGRVRRLFTSKRGCLCMSINNNDARVGLVDGKRLGGSHSCGVNAIHVLDNVIGRRRGRTLHASLVNVTARCTPIDVVNSKKGVGGLFHLTSGGSGGTSLLPIRSLHRVCLTLRMLPTRRHVGRCGLGPSQTSMVIPTTRVFLRITACMGTANVVMPAVKLSSNVVSDLCARGVGMPPISRGSASPDWEVCASIYGGLFI